MGYWKDKEDVKQNWDIDRVFQPDIEIEKQQKMLKGWKKSCAVRTWMGKRRGNNEMKDKRITMKDVAKEAGVSTATVSYVLNYSDTERISHETRLRVFEAANKLNYVPNMAAKALSEKKSYLVGMIINKRARSKKSKIYQYYDLADEIRVILHALGYDMFLISAEEIEEGVSIGIRRTLDAVFIVDLEESLFKKIANKFFVPAIFIDGYVADPLFCKVLVDSKELLDKAQEILGEEFYVVLEDYFNDYLLEYIRKE